MRSFFPTIVFALAFVVTLKAVPADPNPIRFVQPDGSVIMIQMKGDEFFGWATEYGSGRLLEMDAQGYYRPATDLAAFELAKAEGVRMREWCNEQRAASAPVRMQLSRNGVNYLPSPMTDMTFGTRHIPVVLLQFSDVKFVISNPKTAFDNLLNQTGYSENGAVGSVNDFYHDNSNGRFNPVFDVFGPVTLSGAQANYGNSKGTAAAISGFKEALRAIDSEVDFSQYDYNNDGYIDMILFYYAGHNTAEGGGSNTIWPHQYFLNYNGNITLDGKRGYRYFCTSELKGASGNTMCGIGTTCHEFGHSLGLPDFYDTDYEENGSAATLYNYSTMCSGSYNNNGRTPPYFNTIERAMLGWMDIPAATAANGNYTVEAIQDDKSFRINTSVNNEFFILESRTGTGWDAPLRAGMVVYHVDMSSTQHPNGRGTCEYNWNHWENTNDLNAYSSHPCFYIVPSRSASSTAGIPFPGSGNVTTYAPVDWSGSRVGIELSNIAYNTASKTVTFKLENSNARILSGKVSDSGGSPLYGASLTLTPSGTTTRYTTTSAINGSYSIVLPDTETATAFTLAVSLSGFTGTTLSISGWTKGGIERNVTLQTTLTLYDMGFNAIEVPATYKEGDVFYFKMAKYYTTPNSVTWYYDGVLTTAESVVLTSGNHTVTAVLQYSSGLREVLETELVLDNKSEQGN